MILTILFIFFCIRLISLKILMQHAKQLKVDGAVEYGIKNSKFLAITHVLIYMSAAIEAFIRKDTFSLLNGIGLIILIIAYIMLFIVIKTLGRIWTLKLFIGKDDPEELGWNRAEEIWEEPIDQENIDSQGMTKWDIFKKYILGNPVIWILCISNVFV